VNCLNRSVVAVSGDPLRPVLLDALSLDETDCGVIFVESIGCAYSRIKQVTPYLVIVFCDITDPAACQLLSMLKTDPDLSCVLVMTCASGPLNRVLEDIASEMFGPVPPLIQAVQMN
jgi:hypothetical protein